MSVNGTGVVAETPTERMAYTLYLLFDQGAELRTAEVARFCGLSWQGADDMLNRASRVVPITKYDTKWRRY